MSNYDYLQDAIEGDYTERHPVLATLVVAGIVALILGILFI